MSRRETARGEGGKPVSAGGSPSLPQMLGSTDTCVRFHVEEGLPRRWSIIWRDVSAVA